VSAAILTTAVLLALIAGIALFAYLFFSRRRSRIELAHSGPPVTRAVEWTRQAGDDLGELNEPARCDLVFAIAELDDDRSRALLIDALADPSSTVSLAAAHALARKGHGSDVQLYASKANGERSKELLELLSLID
jgi:hypothetical protein